MAAAGAVAAVRGVVRIGCGGWCAEGLKFPCALSAEAEVEIPEAWASLMTVAWRPGDTRGSSGPPLLVCPRGTCFLAPRLSFPKRSEAEDAAKELQEMLRAWGVRLESGRSAEEDADAANLKWRDSMTEALAARDATWAAVKMLLLLLLEEVGAVRREGLELQRSRMTGRQGYWRSSLWQPRALRAAEPLQDTRKQRSRPLRVVLLWQEAHADAEAAAAAAVGIPVKEVIISKLWGPRSAWAIMGEPARGAIFSLRVATWKHCRRQVSWVVRVRRVRLCSHSVVGT